MFEAISRGKCVCLTETIPRAKSVCIGNFKVVNVCMLINFNGVSVCVCETISMG